MKILTKNKQAFFDYHILEKLEAGIALTGDEVKSIRAGHVSLIGSYATFHKGELMLLNCNITPYAQAYEKKMIKQRDHVNYYCIAMNLID